MNLVGLKTDHMKSEGERVLGIEELEARERGKDLSKMHYMLVKKFSNSKKIFWDK